MQQPMPVAVRSEAQVCSGSIAGIAGSNPTEAHECSSAVFAVCRVGGGLCDELITLSKEYKLVCA